MLRCGELALAKVPEIRALGVDLPVILMTGGATMELAVQAVRVGAWDFLSKPISQGALKLSVDRALQHQQLTRERQSLRALLDGAGAP